MYCCCNERRSGSWISAGVRTCADAQPTTTTKTSASSLILDINHPRNVTDLSCGRNIEYIAHSYLLFLRRVESEVQVRIRHFVFAQVIKHRHSSPEWHRLRAHDDRIAGSDLSNKLRHARPRSESA